MSTYEQPLISVDVVPLQLDRQTGCVTVVLGERIFEPFLGQLALPGVLLQHELAREAATRALREKTGIDVEAVTIADTGVFDNPDRDPRGPTLSIAHLAVLDPSTVAGGRGRVVPLTEAAGLPFDHDSIVKAAAKTLLDSLWQDAALTRQLLGATFSSRDAGNAQRSLEDVVHGEPVTRDAANLGRKLANSDWVARTEDTGAISPAGGRPPAMWRWL